MTVALILLGALLGVGALLYAHHRLSGNDTRDASAGDSGNVDSTTAGKDVSNAETESECCGLHITCERDSLLSALSEKIEYFDDEELDAFAGRAADSYSAAESEQFRDILLTTRPDEIAAWARSLQLRGITLPSDVRDELLLIVAERRNISNRS